jgi:hypothetical protein
MEYKKLVFNYKGFLKSSKFMENIVIESTPRGNSYFYKLYRSACMAKKPPLGVQPKSKVDYDREEIDIKRGIQITEAMHRYLKRDIAFPSEWLDELEEIHTSMTQRRVEDGFKDGTVKNL